MRAKRQADIDTRPDGRMGMAASEEEFALVNSVATHDWPVLVPLSPLSAGIPGSSVTTFHVSLRRGGKEGTCMPIVNIN